jgi:hypothetical protein
MYVFSFTFYLLECALYLAPAAVELAFENKRIELNQ